jgi:predicted DNA-binding transcriptional regulator YafY
MDIVYRQWLIIRMIPRKGRISTCTILDRLASEYGIDTTLRTVQRDLVSLAANFPLESDDLRPAGWSWMKDAPALDIPSMDPVTALTFYFADRHISRMLPNGVTAALKPYVQAAEQRLRQKSTSQLYDWPEKVRVVSRNLSFIHPKVSEDIAEVVYNALLQKKRFFARYRGVNAEPREYEVSPLGLAFVEGLTYLVATLNDYEDPILLLLHRMQEVSLLDKPVSVPEGFDFDRYVAKELSFPVGKEIILKVVFFEKSDVVRLEESPIANDQSVRDLRNGSYEMTATVTDTVQLRWWLRGYGNRVEVLGPKGLRQEFVELVRELAANYGL